MPGWQFVLRRLLQAIPLMLAVIILTFGLVHLAPGDPALMLAGEAGATTAEILAAVRADYGLDKSVPVQLGIYLSKVLTGDLGFSYSYQRPVIDMVLERIPATLLLVGTATVLAMVMGVTLGVVAAWRPASIMVTVVDILSLFGYATPIFWAGIILLLVFSVYLPWFPSHGMSTVGAVSSGRWSDMLDVLHHLVLPMATLGFVYLALYSRLMRASMLNVLGLDFVRTARAKGLAELAVVGKHALRNALLPVVTVAGIQIGQVLAGAVLVETVFAWPGMGRLLLDSILRRDYPLLIGIVCLSSLAIIVVNLLTDLIYGTIDPRIRYG